MINYDPNYLWQTNDNKKIKLSDMTDEHLLNAILYLRQTFQSKMADLFYRMKQNQDNSHTLASIAASTVDKMHVLTYEAALRGLVVDFSVKHPDPKLFVGRRLNRRQRRDLRNKHDSISRSTRNVNI